MTVIDRVYVYRVGDDEVQVMRTMVLGAKICISAIDGV